MSYEWCALTAAFLWAFSTLISATPAEHLGAFSYSRWRMGFTALALISIAWLTDGWSTVESTNITPMMLSGLVGIFIGDTALFACMNRMGPRRASLLFSCHAVFSTILGYFLFSHTMKTLELFGSLLIFSGVVMAIFFGRQAKQDVKQHKLEQIKGNLWVAIGLGVIAALCQALGGIIAKPVMLTNIDPIAASAMRMIAAFIAHVLLRLSGANIARSIKPITLPILGMTILNGFLAMVLGMTLILYALQEGDVGMVALLSSTTPVMILPLLWFHTKQRPNRFSWFGAILAVIGVAMLVV